VSGSITRQEKIFVALVALAVLMVTSMPYAFGYFTSPKDMQFMGILFNVPDTAQYFSWARELGRAVLIENKLTPEPNPPIFFNLLWFVLGRIAIFFDLGYAETLQGFRWFAAALFLAVAYQFCSLFFEKPQERKFALLTIVLSSGIGWLLVVYKQWSGELLFPLDLYVAEANSFFSIMVAPHLILSAALMAVVFILWLKSVEQERLKPAVFAGLVGLILGLEHAYDLITVYAVLIILTFLLLMTEGVHWRRIGSLVIIGTLSAPPALYFVYITQRTPTWRGVLEQYGNAGVFTPDPFHLLILLGVAFVVGLAGFGSPTPGGRDTTRWLLVKVWFGASLFLAYLPTHYQIKMLTGWQIPIAILAVHLLCSHVRPAIVGRMPRFERALPALFLIMILPTNVYLLSWRFVDLGRHERPYYLYRDEMQALDWLQVNSNPSEVVLGSITIGGYVPSMSGNKAFLAHWAQTLDYYEKERQVRRFFAQATPEEQRLDILRRYNVRYIFYGREERALGSYDPRTASYLNRAFVAADTAIFQVKDEFVP